MHAAPKTTGLMAWEHAKSPHLGVPPAYQCCLDRASWAQVHYLADPANYIPESVVHPGRPTHLIGDLYMAPPPLAQLRALRMRLEQACGYRPDTAILSKALCERIRAARGGELDCLPPADTPEEHLRVQLDLYRVFALEDHQWPGDDVALVCLQPDYRSIPAFAHVEIQAIGGEGYGPPYECGMRQRWRVVPGDPRVGMLVKDFGEFPGWTGTLHRRRDP